MKELQRLVPGTQEERAAFIGVDQATWGRWEGAVAAGREPPMGAPSAGKLRRAVEDARKGNPEYFRGKREALAIFEEAMFPGWTAAVVLVY